MGLAGVGVWLWNRCFEIVDWLGIDLRVLGAGGVFGWGGWEMGEGGRW